MANETVKNIFSDFNDLFSDLGSPVNNTEERQVTTGPVDNASNGNITIKNTNNSSLIQDAQAKIGMIKREMNDLFVERDAVIDCMIYALISGQSLLMLGDPGTARVDINA